MYDKDISIDESAIEQEWLRQSDLVMKYGLKLAEAEFHLNRKSEELSSKKAELDIDIRSNPEKYDLEKVTEPAIKAAMSLDEGYKEVNTKILQLQLEVQGYRAVLRALDSKEKALSSLTKLHGQEYFAGPMIPRNIVEERKQFQEDLDEKVGNRLSSWKKRMKDIVEDSDEEIPSKPIKSVRKK